MLIHVLFIVKNCPLGHIVLDKMLTSLEYAGALVILLAITHFELFT